MWGQGPSHKGPVRYDRRHSVFRHVLIIVALLVVPGAGALMVCSKVQGSGMGRSAAASFTVAALVMAILFVALGLAY